MLDSVRCFISTLIELEQHFVAFPLSVWLQETASTSGIGTRTKRDESRGALRRDGEVRATVRPAQVESQNDPRYLRALHVCIGYAVNRPGHKCVHSAEKGNLQALSVDRAHRRTSFGVLQRVCVQNLVVYLCCDACCPSDHVLLRPMSEPS